ncbi:MAG: HAMP domain-containing sensor histidine kinase [Proteobacteria bacterium]|nr:HAMP domain-containing sensor histidine kinase [Pseudomonadota bacterium]
MGREADPVPAAGVVQPDRNFSALAGHATEGVALCRQGLVTWVSRRFVEITGRSGPDALVGKPIEAVLEDAGAGFPPADLDAAVEVRVRGFDAPERRVRAHRSHGETDGEEVWMIQDHVRPRSTEMELLRLSRELRDANEEVADLRDRSEGVAAERDDLLVVLSHELRTPLTIIQGYQRLLLTQEAGSLNDEQRRFVEDSAKSCRRMNEFIARLLDASHDPSRQDSLELVPGCVDALVEGVLGFMRPLLRERDLRVDLELDPEARHARFDPVRVEQVLTNLIGNAIKYTEPDSAIEVSTAPLAAAGHRFVEVSVSDRGPGIAPEDRQRIFEPYVRTHSASHSGLGLGLAICRRIVEAHGGRIGVEGRPEGGSRFHFTLPAGGEPAVSVHGQPS